MWWISPLALLLGVLLLLWTPWGLHTALRVGVGPAGLTLEEARGNWMRGIEVRGAAFNTENISVFADTLRVQYNLSALIRGKIRVSKVEASGVDFAVLPTTEEPDIVSGEPPDMLITGIIIRNSRVQIPLEPDTTLVMDVNILQGQFSLAEELHVVLDSTDIIAYAGSTPIGVSGPMAMEGFMIRTDSLQIFNDRNDVLIDGFFSLPIPDQEVAANFVVRADTLTLADLSLFTQTPASVLPIGVHTTVREEDGRYHLTGLFTDPEGGQLDMDLAVAIGSYEVYRANANTFNLAVIDTALDATIDVRLEGALEGNSLSDMKGAVQLWFDKSTVAGVSLNRGEAALQVADGAAELVLASRINGAAVGITGTASVLDQDQWFMLEGHFLDLDISRMGGPQSALRGTLTASGDNSGKIDAEIQVVPGSLGELPLQNATFTAALDNELLQVDAAVRSDSGSLGASFQIQLQEGEEEIRGSAWLENFDVARAAALGARSAVSGSVSMHTRGAWPPDSGEVAIALGNGHYAGVAVDTVRVLAGIEDVSVITNGMAASPLGELSWRGVLQPFGSVMTYSVNEMAFNSIDLGQLVEGWETSISGAASARGLGPENHTVELALTSSTINDQPVETGDINLRLRGDNFGASLAVVTPEGGVSIAAEGNLANQSYLITETSFEKLDLGSFLGIDSLSTSLTGAVDSVEANAAHPEYLDVAAHIQLDSSRVNDQIIDAAFISVEADSGLFHGRVQAQWAGGELAIDTVWGRWLDSIPSYGVKMAAENIDLEALAGIPALFSGDVSIEGEGASFTASLNAEDSRYGTLSVSDFATVLEADSTFLQVDTLHIVSNALELDGGGGLALRPGREQSALFSAGGVVHDPAPLMTLFSEMDVSSDLVPGDTLWVEARSNQERVSFHAGIRLGAVTLDDVRMLEVDSEVQGIVNLDGLAMPTLYFHYDASRVSVPGVSARTASVQAVLNSDTLAFSGDLIVDENRNAAVYATLDLTNQRLLLEQFDVNLGPDRWRLDQNSEILLGDRYQIRNFLMVAEDQEIVMDGVIDPDGSQRLGLTVYNFRSASLADLLGFPEMGGVINADVLLSGEASAPQLRGSLDMVLEASEESVGTFTGSAEYAEGQLQIDARMSHSDSSTLTMEGNYPVDFRVSTTGEPPAWVGNDQVSLAIQADEFNVGWIEPFMDPALIGDVEGYLNGDLSIQGSTDEPRITGEAALEGARVEMADLGIVLEGLEAAISFDGDSIKVNNISTTSGGGTLEGSGSVELSALTLGSMDIIASLDRFRVMDNEGFLAHLTGDIFLRGTTEEPKVTGEVRLTNADIRPSENASQAYAPVPFTPEDVRMLEQYFNIRVTGQDTTTFVFYDALAMDMTVIIGSDVWLRSRSAPEMNILFQGVLDILKEPQEDAQVLGTVQVVPAQSYVRQFGRRFDIDVGRLTFSGPMLTPSIEMQAIYEVPIRNTQDAPVRIFLGIDGSILEEGGLTFRLSSDPPMLDESDIISYIATGRPAAEAFQMAEVNTLQVGRDIAVNQLTNLIAGAAGAELGFDVVEIEQQGSRGVTLTAGKRISRDLYASISWPIALGSGSTPQPGRGSESSKQIIVEYTLLAWLLARLRGDAKTIGTSLIFQYVY